MSHNVNSHKKHNNDTFTTSFTSWEGWHQQYSVEGKPLLSQLTRPVLVPADWPRAWCISHWYSYTVIAALAKPRLACRLPIKAGVKFYKPRKVLLSSFTCKSRDLWVVTPTDRCLRANVMAGNCIRLVVERVIRCFTFHSNPPVKSLIASKLSI